MIYHETHIQRSQKNRRCVGCENFVTIAVGEPYWSCFCADGGESNRYAMCDPCMAHLKECKECQEVIKDGDCPDIRGHRLELAKIPG